MILAIGLKHDACFVVALFVVALFVLALLVLGLFLKIDLCKNNQPML